MGNTQCPSHKQLDLNTTSLTPTHKKFIDVSRASSWWSSEPADLATRHSAYYTTIFLLKPPRQLLGTNPLLLPTNCSPSQTRRINNKVAAAAICSPAPICQTADLGKNIEDVEEDERNNNHGGTAEWLMQEKLDESMSVNKTIDDKEKSDAASEVRQDDASPAATVVAAAGPESQPLCSINNNNQLVEHILRTLSTSSSSSSSSSTSSMPMLAHRRASDTANNQSGQAEVKQTTIQPAKQNTPQHHQFRLRVASVLAISPKSLVTSPFRGLRRAASASTSSISCCSSSSPSTAHLGAAALSSSSALSAYPYPRSHTTLMVLPAVGTAVATSNTPRGSTNISGSRSAGSASSSRYGSKEWLTNSMVMEEDGGGSGDYDNNNLILNYPYNPGDGNNNSGESGSTAPSAYNFIARRPRPPLNRAIPPIPESKSNESIISAQSSSLAASSTARRQSITKNNNDNGGGITGCTTDTHMGLKEEIEDKSVVIENPMAQNLGAKPPSLSLTTSSRLPRLKEHNKKGSHSKTPEDPTKSPLMSMAHSVKHRLSKFGTRFGVGKDHQQSEPHLIKASTSLMAMRRDVSGGELSSSSGSKIPKCNKSTKNLVNLRLLKSSSMEESSASERKKRLREDQKRLQDNQKAISQMSQSASPAAGYGWYTSGDSAVPRRLPSTTLIPISPMTGSVMLGSGFGARRFVPEDCPVSEPVAAGAGAEKEKIDVGRLGEVAERFGEQVGTSKVLNKNKELDYIDLNTIFEPRAEKVDTGMESSDVWIDQSVSSKGIRESPPPLPKSSPPKESGCDLWEVPLAGSLRKTPQSFPPMPTSVGPRRPGSLKSALSVSFAAGDEREKNTAQPLKAADKKRRESPSTSSHGLFSTRSLRLAAAKIAEASPILRRKTKASSVDIDIPTSTVEPRSEEAPPKKSNSFSSSGTKKSDRKATFQKSASISSEQEYIARTKKGKKAAAEKKSLATVSNSTLTLAPSTAEEMRLIKKLENSFDLATKKFDLRTVRSIHQKKKASRAPLAEIESSRVAEKDSPAVEVPPIDFAHQLNSSPGQRRRYLTSFSIAKSVVKTEANSDKQGNYKDVVPPPKPGPTLAELLTSPPAPSRNQPLLVLDGIEPEPVVTYQLAGVESSDKEATLTTTALDSHRSGLIDDEIVDQPLLISTSDFALIDDITTISSSCSAISPPIPPAPVNPPATFSTCLLRYCLEDEDDRASCATNDSFIQSVGVNNNRSATRSAPKKSGLPKPTGSSSLSSVPEMSKEKKTMGTVKSATTTTASTFPKTQDKTTKVVERTQVVSTTGNRPKSQKEKGESTSSSRNSSLNTTPSSHKTFPNVLTSSATTTTTTTALNIRRNGGPSMETTDQAPFPLPEMLTDFKSQLCQLQEAMKKDFEEIERLRLENESMRHQLAERDQLIRSLQLQMQQLLQLQTNTNQITSAEDT